MRHASPLLACFGAALFGSCVATAPAVIPVEAKPKTASKDVASQETGTAADIDIDFKAVIGGVSVCKMQRSVWSAKSQTNSVKSAVEPAWVALFDGALSKAGRLCVELYPAPDSYLARVQAQPAIPAPVSQAEFLLIAKGEATNAQLAPLVVRGPEINGGKSSLCFDLAEANADPSALAVRAEIQVRYAVKSKSSEYSNCKVEVAERSVGEVLRSVSGGAGGDVVTGEVWVTRKQLERLFAELRLQATEVCYSSTAAPAEKSNVLRGRVEQLLPLIVQQFGKASLPIGEALAKARVYQGEDAGAALQKYLQRKSEELKSKKQTTFDGANEIEASALGLVSGKNKLTVKLDTVSDDLRKTDSEVTWAGELRMPPTLDVFLVGSVNASRAFSAIAIDMNVVGEKVVRTIQRVPIFSPAVTFRTQDLVPPGGDSNWGNKNWSQSLTLTNSNERFESVKYRCDGGGCPWSYAVNRSRPVCLDPRTGGQVGHACQYEEDFSYSQDGKTVTVYRMTNPNQFPSHAYTVTIRVSPSTICSEDNFMP